MTLQTQACLTCLPPLNTSGTEIFTIQAWRRGQGLCWVMLSGLVLEPAAERQPPQAASCGQKKPRRALSVTDTPANCWPLTPFIQCSPFRHRAAPAGNEREAGEGMSSPQGITHSAGTGRLVCSSAQSIPYTNTNLLGQRAHTAGRLYTPGIHTKTHTHSPHAYRNSHYIFIHRDNACELAKNAHKPQLYLQAEFSCTRTHMRITHLQTLSPCTQSLFPLPCTCWLSLKDPHILSTQTNLCSARHREPQQHAPFVQMTSQQNSLMGVRACGW